YDRSGLGTGYRYPLRPGRPR
ncbi:hypothetical protein KIPB_011286, partial [Kipferlia bialata]